MRGRILHGCMQKFRAHVVLQTHVDNMCSLIDRPDQAIGDIRLQSRTWIDDDNRKNLCVPAHSSNACCIRPFRSHDSRNMCPMTTADITRVRGAKWNVATWKNAAFEFCVRENSAVEQRYNNRRIACGHRPSLHRANICADRSSILPCILK